MFDVSPTLFGSGFFLDDNLGGFWVGIFLPAVNPLVVPFFLSFEIRVQVMGSVSFLPIPFPPGMYLRFRRLSKRDFYYYGLPRVEERTPMEAGGPMA